MHLPNKKSVSSLCGGEGAVKVDFISDRIFRVKQDIINSPISALKIRVILYKATQNSFLLYSIFK